MALDRDELKLGQIHGEFFVSYLGVQWTAISGFGGQIRSAEVPQHAGKGRACGGSSPLGDPSENVVSKPADEAQETNDKIEQKRGKQQQSEFQSAMHRSIRFRCVTGR